MRKRMVCVAVCLFATLFLLVKLCSAATLKEEIFSGEYYQGELAFLEDVLKGNDDDVWSVLLCVSITAGDGEKELSYYLCEEQELIRQSSDAAVINYIGDYRAAGESFNRIGHVRAVVVKNGTAFTKAFQFEIFADTGEPAEEYNLVDFSRLEDGFTEISGTEYHTRYGKLFENVTLKLDAGVYSCDTDVITGQLCNDSSRKMMYWPGIILERLEDGEWKHVQYYGDDIRSEVYLSKHRTEDITADLSAVMPPPQLSPGTYRIVQEVFYPGLWHIGMDGSGKNVCAEFVLQ